MHQRSVLQFNSNLSCQRIISKCEIKELHRCQEKLLGWDIKVTALLFKIKSKCYTKTKRTVSKIEKDKL